MNSWWTAELGSRKTRL